MKIIQWVKQVLGIQSIHEDYWSSSVAIDLRRQFGEAVSIELYNHFKGFEDEFRPEFGAIDGFLCEAMPVHPARFKARKHDQYYIDWMVTVRGKKYLLSFNYVNWRQRADDYEKEHGTPEDLPKGAQALSGYFNKLFAQLKS